MCARVHRRSEAIRSKLDLPNGIGEADRRIVQREGAGKNSYRDSDVKALVWPAAYLLALGAQINVYVDS